MDDARNWIFEYQEKLLSGEIIAGKWILLLYGILTERIRSGVYLYDAKKANKAVNFIEEFCHHSEGRSDLLKLELWQKAMVSALFGVLDPQTGRRQFREVFLLVARKNGKTLLAAAIAAYVAYIDGEYGSKIYMLAPKLEQSDLCYDAFYQITQSDPELKEVTKKRTSTSRHSTRRSRRSRLIAKNQMASIRCSTSMTRWRRGQERED